MLRSILCLYKISIPVQTVIDSRPDPEAHHSGARSDFFHLHPDDSAVIEYNFSQFIDGAVRETARIRHPRPPLI